MKQKNPSPPILPILTDSYLDIEEEAVFDGAHFVQEDLSYSTGENIILRGCQLDNVRLHKARFDRFECSNVVFNHCDLSNIEWFGASLHQVVFNNCKLTGANFADSYLRDCQFTDCIGEFSSFSNGNFKVVHFENCRLSQSEFNELTWQHVQFRNCDLDDSNWFFTKLKGLDLRGNYFEKIALSQELVRGLIVNQQQAVVIAAGLGLHIEE